MNTFEKLETLKAEKKELLKGLQNLPFRDKKESKEYKRLQDVNNLISEYSKQLEDENIKNRLSKVNTFNTAVNALIEKIKTYNGDFVKADGTSTKKFKDFCASLGSSVFVYAKRRSAHSSIEIFFVGDHNGLRKEIYINHLENFKEYTSYNFEDVKQARSKHNELLKELERIQKELNTNYRTATADGELHHYGQNYTFD